MPARLTSPSVGLMPTMPLVCDGQMIEPSVSVPTAAAHRFAATATPEPELEPHGLRSSAYGLRVWPPRLLHPLTEWVERKFAHSLRLVLPRMTAPASRSLRATVASCAAIEPSSASEPAVVSILSAVSMLSLIRIGMPWSGPRGPRSRRSASSVVGDGQRVGVDLDDRVERGAGLVDRGDAAEIHFCDRAGCHLARLHPGLEFGYRQFGHVGYLPEYAVGQVANLSYTPVRCWRRAAITSTCAGARPARPASAPATRPAVDPRSVSGPMATRTMRRVG